MIFGPFVDITDAFKSLPKHNLQLAFNMRLYETYYGSTGLRE